MQVPNQQYEIFKTSLTGNTFTSHVLPESVETDRLYQMEGFFAGSRGYEGLWFFFKQNEEGNFFMDYYFQNDDTDGHYRTDHTGNHIKLENMITQWRGQIRTGDPVEDKKQREREIIHNKGVHAILKAKGFRTDTYT